VYSSELNDINLAKIYKNSKKLSFYKYIILWHVEAVVLAKTVNQKDAGAMEVAQQEVVKNYQFLIGCQI
jgi:hypothetical protein